MPTDKGARASANNAAASSTNASSNTSTEKRRPRRESDIREEIGVAEQERRALAASTSQRVRREPSRTPGGPDTIHGETIGEMRARVAAERASAEPTEFQRSLIGNDVGRSSLSGADVTNTAGAVGTGVPSSTAGTSSTPGSGSTG